MTTSLCVEGDCDDVALCEGGYVTTSLCVTGEYDVVVEGECGDVVVCEPPNVNPAQVLGIIQSVFACRSF